MIESTYSAVLTQNSPIFARTDCKTLDYYYEAVQMEVIQSGCYNLAGNSSIDVYGHLYKDEFSPLFPMHHLFAEDGRDYRDRHFELQASLLNNTKYILVATTFHPNMTGPLNVLVTGPNGVNLSRIREYFHDGYFLLSNFPISVMDTLYCIQMTLHQSFNQYIHQH